MSREAKLKKETRFGRIPFDHYALEHWDYDAPKETDGEQWKRLAKGYLAMPPIDRRSYHDKAAELSTTTGRGASHPNLVFDKIERVLRPFQTNEERNASELSGPRDPIWVQLCYDEALHSKYAELGYWAEVGASEGSVDVDMIMDNESLYGCLDDDTDRLRQALLERMPGLCDSSRSDYHRNDASRRARRLGNPDSLENQSHRMANVVYFADREAIEREFVKAMWLDEHGNCLRITNMVPSSLTGIRCMFLDGYTMEEAVLSSRIYDPDDDDVDNGKSSKEHSGINKKSADYRAGHEAGYDAGLKDGVQAMQDTQYDVGYHDGKQGLRSRTGH